jgi:hypothetical protein
MRGPRTCRRHWCSAVLSVFAGSSALAQQENGSEPVRVRLEASARAQDSACVRRRVVTSRTEANLRRAVFTPSPSESDVTLRLDVTNETRRAELTLEESATGASLGQRKLEAQSCPELEASVVLALTLMLDFAKEEIAERRDAANQANGGVTGTATGSETATSTGDAKEPPEPVPSSATPTQKAEPPRDTPPPKESPERREQHTSAGEPNHWMFDVQAEGRTGWGWEPATDLGVGGAVGIMPTASFRAEVGVIQWRTQSFERLGGELTLARRSMQVSLSPYKAHFGAVTVRVGAQGLLDQIRARGDGFSPDRAATAWVGNVGVVGAVNYNLSHALFARATSFLLVPLNAADFVVSAPSSPRTAFSMAPIAGGVSLGLGLQLD